VEILELEYINNFVLNFIYNKGPRKNTVCYLVKQSEETGSLSYQWKGDA
jgi:hypothetical protein